MILPWGDLINMNGTRKVNAMNDRLRRVEGRHNALVKELRHAFSRGELTETRECAVEGFRIVMNDPRLHLRR